MEFRYNFDNTKRIGTMVSTMSVVMEMATSLKEAAVVNIFPHEYNAMVASYSCREMYQLYIARDSLLIDIIRTYVLPDEIVDNLVTNKYFNKKERIKFLEAGLEKELYYIDWLRLLIEKIYYPILSGKAFSDEKQFEVTKSALEILKEFADEREKVMLELETIIETNRERAPRDSSDGRQTKLSEAAEKLYEFAPQSKVADLYDYMSATGVFKAHVGLVDFAIAINTADFDKIISKVKKSYLLLGLKILAPFSICENGEWLKACAANLNVPIYSMGKNKTTLGKWADDLVQILS